MNLRHWQGCAVGLVTDLNDPEQSGRVKVRYPWLDDEVTSHWARMRVGQGGGSRGNFVRPEIGDEVLLLFEQGDPNQPWIIGVLWNGKDAPPGPGNPDGKNDAKWIQSRAGHQLTFNDGGDGGFIDFHDGKQRLHTKFDVPGEHVHWKADSGFIQISAPVGLIKMKCKTFNLHSTEKTDVSVTNKHELSVTGTRAVKVQQQNFDQTAGSSLSITTPNLKVDTAFLIASLGSTSVTVGDVQATIEPQLDMALTGPVTRTAGTVKIDVGEYRTTLDGSPSGPLTWTGGLQSLDAKGILVKAGGPATIMAGLVNATGGHITMAKDGGDGQSIDDASLVSLLGGLLLLNPGAITMPATKMLDVVMGMDNHTTLPAPVPAPPIPLFPHTGMGPLLLDVRLSVLVNFMPAAGSGATAVGAHIPPIPPPPWAPLPMMFRGIITAAIQALFMAPVAAAIEMVRGMVSGNKAGESGQGIERMGGPGQTYLYYLKRCAPKFSSPLEILRSLKSLIPFPIFNASVAVASPSVQVGDTAQGMTMMPFCNSCSDIPCIPNAAALGFSNVLVGIDLKAMLEQMFWNAVHSAASWGIGQALKGRNQRRPNDVEGRSPSRLANARAAIGRWAGRARCSVLGEPIDVVSGTHFDECDDLRLPGPLPFTWLRHYNSVAAGAGLGGVCGFGWRLNIEAFLTRHDRDAAGRTQFWALHTADMRIIELPMLGDYGERVYLRGERLEFCRADDETWDVTDADGLILRFREVLGRDVAWLAEMRDRHGNVVALRRDEDGRVTSFVDSMGRCVRLDYRDDRLTEVWLERRHDRWAPRRLLAYAYDDLGQLVEADGPDGKYRYGYDEEGRVTVKANPTGYRWYWHHDELGRVTCSYGEDLRDYYRFDYQTGARITIAEDHAGARRQYAYDEHALVKNVVDGEGGLTQYVRDADGFVVEETDPAGRKTERRYDEQGRLVEEIQPNGGKSIWTYDARGLLLQHEDPCHAVTRSVYDTRGNAIRVKHPDGGETLRRFDAAGRVVAEALPDGSTHTYVFDEAGDCVEENHDGSVVKCRYDAFGLRVSETTAEGETRYEHDANGRVVARTGPDGRVARWRYDAAGWCVEQTLVDGTVWRFEHDEAGRLVREESPEGRTIRTRIGLNERVEGHRDAAGRGYAYRYDRNGELIAHETDDGVVDRYFVDAAGRELEFAYDDGGWRQYTPGPLVHPLEVVTSDGIRQTFKLDACDRVIEAVEAPARAPRTRSDDRPDPEARRTSLQRAPDGTVLEDIGPYGRVRRRFAAGRRLALYQVDGARLEITRDERGRPVRVVAPGEHVFDLAYGAGGLVRCASAGGATVLRAAGFWAIDDPARRPLLSYDLAFDEMGRTAAETLRGAAAPRACYEHRFRFDRDGRLLESYDESGNRLLSAHRHGAGHRLIEDAQGPVSYDARGRVVARQIDGGTQRLWWDDLDRLREVENPDGTVFRYRYDALQRLVERIEDPVAGPVRWWRFVWDGDRLAAEEGPDGARVHYLHLEGEGYVPWAAWVVEGSGAGRLYLLHSDRRGAIIAATAPDGELAWAGEYTAYGECFADGAGFDQRLRLPGQWSDPATGLYYNRYRWYEPTWGRYLSPDPLGVEGGDHRYAYASGDPIHRTDPLGLQDCGGKRGLLGRGRGGNRRGNNRRATETDGAPPTTGRLPRHLRNKMDRIQNQTAAGGNRGVSGSVSHEEAMRLGEAFVGPGHRPMSNGAGLVSADGRRTFRFPSPKRGVNPRTGEPWSRTGTQANFETHGEDGGRPVSNVHLDVDP